MLSREEDKCWVHIGTASSMRLMDGCKEGDTDRCSLSQPYYWPLFPSATVLPGARNLFLTQPILQK